MPTKTVDEILNGIKESYPYPFNYIMACNSGVFFGLTEDERRGLESGRLKFEKKHENKKLLRELGQDEDLNMPDFPWNKNAD